MCGSNKYMGNLYIFHSVLLRTLNFSKKIKSLQLQKYHLITVQKYLDIRTRCAQILYNKIIQDYWKKKRCKKVERTTII